MIEFILFILICMAGYHSVNTRTKLMAVAAHVDELHRNINEAFNGDRERLDEVEAHLVAIDKILAGKTAKKRGSL